MSEVTAGVYALLNLLGAAGFLVAIFGWMNDHTKRYPMALLIASLAAFGLGEWLLALR